MISNGRITKSVSIDDIKTTLNETSMDLGTLCASTKINKWSKYKPFRNSAIFFNQDMGSGNDRDTAIAAVNYGLVPFGDTALATIVNQYRSNASADKGWKYNQVLPTSTTPARIADFINYYHGAQCPFTRLSTNIVNGKLFREQELSITAIAYDSDEYCVKLSDIALINGGNYGVVIFNATQSKYMVVTEEKTISQVSGMFSLSVAASQFTADNSTNETCYVYPIIKVGSKYYTIPGLGGEEFIVQKKAANVVTAKATKWKDGNKYYVIFSVEAKSNYAGTFTNGSIRLRYNDNEFDDAREGNEQFISIPNVSMPADTYTQIYAETTGVQIAEDLYNKLRIMIRGSINGNEVNAACEAKMIDSSSKPDLNPPGGSALPSQ